jgi:hypothetical protein
MGNGLKVASFSSNGSKVTPLLCKSNLPTTARKSRSRWHLHVFFLPYVEANRLTLYRIVAMISFLFLFSGAIYRICFGVFAFRSSQNLDHHWYFLLGAVHLKWRRTQNTDAYSRRLFIFPLTEYPTASRKRSDYLFCKDIYFSCRLVGVILLSAGH